MVNAETDWKEFLVDGKNYLKKAVVWAKNGKFDNDVIYNLILISIEKNIMAICMSNSYLPENHTLSDLVYALKKVQEIDPILENDLLEIEKYQMICSVNDYARSTTQIKDINFVLDVGQKVYDLTTYMW